MTRSAVVAVVLLFACLTAIDNAVAQETAKTPRLGLTFGVSSGSSTSGQIGFVYEMSDRWALRPELSFSARSSSGSSGASTSDAWTFGATVTAIRYVAHKDNVRAYIGPRFTYNHSWSGYAGSTDYTSSAYGVAASLGLQYDLARRIAIYGEVGVGYGYTTNTSGSVSGGHTHSVTSGSRLGVNLYF